MTRHRWRAAILALHAPCALLAGCGERDAELPSPTAQATRPAPTPGATLKPLPPLAKAGPTVAPLGALWPSATDAAGVDGAALWGWAKRAATSGESEAWRRLTPLVEATKARAVHDQVWAAVWAHIERPQDTGGDAQAALDEAVVLSRAIEAATGDRSYRTRVREWIQSQDREGARRRWIEARIAEARRAWEQDENADAARARLTAARTSTKHLKHDATDLIAAIDALASRLPEPKSR